MTSTGSTSSTASAAVAVAFETPKVGGVYVPFIGGTRAPFTGGTRVPFIGGTEEQLLARSIAGAALGAGAQPAAEQPKVKGIYEKVPFRGGARNKAHINKNAIAAVVAIIVGDTSTSQQQLLAYHPQSQIQPPAYQRMRTHIEPPAYQRDHTHTYGSDMTLHMLKSGDDPFTVPLIGQLQLSEFVGLDFRAEIAPNSEQETGWWSSSQYTTNHSHTTHQESNGSSQTTPSL